MFTPISFMSNLPIDHLKQTPVEWASKVCWFLATMMYVTRVISPHDLDKIMLHIKPTTANVIDIEAEKKTVERAISELQSDICHTHELVARAWIDGPHGQEFITRQQQARFVFTHIILTIR